MITLTITPDDEHDLPTIEGLLHEAQVPYREHTDVGTVSVECVDDPTADFWVQRFAAWDLSVQRSGEPEPMQPIEQQASDEVYGGTKGVAAGGE